LWKTIDAIPDELQAKVNDKKKPLTHTVNELVLSYLIHHGYSETASSFARDIEEEDSVKDMDVDMDSESLPRSKNSALKDIKNRQRKHLQQELIFEMLIYEKQKYVTTF
jgi:hypothetical protein